MSYFIRWFLVTLIVLSLPVRAQSGRDDNAAAEAPITNYRRAEPRTQTDSVAAPRAEAPKPRATIEPVYFPNPPAQPAKVAAKPPASEDTWEGWPSHYSQYIGYEAGGSSTSILGRNVIVYGTWKKDVNVEYFFGFSKDADNYTSSNSSTTGATAASSISTFSGTVNPYQLTIGAGQNFRLSHSKWIQVYAGYLGGLTYTTSTSYNTGTTTTNTPNVAAPGDYTSTQTGAGSISQSTDLMEFIGGKIGADFYLKWFPNLALGFASGLLTGFGGATTTTSNTSSGTDSYVLGVRTNPSPVTSTSSSSKTSPGIRASTFGVGGTQFQITSAFTVRYVW